MGAHWNIVMVQSLIQQSFWETQNFMYEFDASWIHDVFSYNVQVGYAGMDSTNERVYCTRS